MRILVTDGTRGNIQALYLLLMCEVEIDAIVVDGDNMGLSNVYKALADMEVDIPVVERMPAGTHDIIHIGGRYNMVPHIDPSSTLFIYMDTPIYVPFHNVTRVGPWMFPVELVSKARMLGMGNDTLRSVMLQKEWFTWDFHHVAAILLYLSNDS